MDAMQQHGAGENNALLASLGRPPAVVTLRMVKSQISFDNSERSLTDCRVCRKRRIVCDRRLPACRKCNKKKIECPGYRQSSDLNWAVSLTPRRFFKGTDLAAVESRSEARNSESKANRCQAKETITRPVVTNESREAIDIFFNPCPWTWSQPTFIPMLPGMESVIRSQDTGRLLHHYCNALSVKLPWVDHKDNPWRTIVVPAALRSGPLLNTILTMATEDFAWAASRQSSAVKFRQESEQYQTRALELLSRQLALDVTTDNARTLHSEETVHLLAAVLLLCNLEMRKPESTVWRVHLKAAHILIQSCSFTTADSTSGMAQFLMLKCASLTAFACMSNFTGDQDELTDYVSRADDSDFIPILRILHKIALTKRQSRGRSTFETVDPAYSWEGCARLREDLLLARRKTSCWISGMAHISTSTQHDLEQVGKMFNLAGLIYGHQALQFDCCLPDCEYWGSQIIDLCGAFHQLHLFSQDVLWPLFIAGTTLGSRTELQKILSTKIDDVAALSGHRNALSALAFLRHFWASQTADRDSWIDFAADWTRQCGDFIII